MTPETRLLIILMTVGISIPISIFIYFEFQLHEQESYEVQMPYSLKDSTVYGQEIDPSTYCSINQYPYIQFCNDQRIEDIMNELLDKAKEYDK